MLFLGFNDHQGQKSLMKMQMFCHGDAFDVHRLNVILLTQ